MVYTNRCYLSPKSFPVVPPACFARASRRQRKWLELRRPAYQTQLCLCRRKCHKHSIAAVSIHTHTVTTETRTVYLETWDDNIMIVLLKQGFTAENVVKLTQKQTKRIIRHPLETFEATDQFKLKARCKGG